MAPNPANAITELCQTEDRSQQRTDNAFSLHAPAQTAQCDIRLQHVISCICVSKTRAHPEPNSERHSHIASLLVSPRGLLVLTHWVQMLTNGKVIGGDSGGGKARPIPFEDELLELA